MVSKHSKQPINDAQPCICASTFLEAMRAHLETCVTPLRNPGAASGLRPALRGAAA